MLQGWKEKFVNLGQGVLGLLFFVLLCYVTLLSFMYITLLGR